jgi:hypothetical protein
MCTDVAADIRLKAAQQIEIEAAQGGIVSNEASLESSEGQVAQSKSKSMRQRLFAIRAGKQKARGRHIHALSFS